jgi:hypothetical protein
MTDRLAAHYLENATKNFRGLKKLAEGALAQVHDEEFFAAPDPESNSLALVVKHIAGNLRSRFTDFLTSDGEKPDRRRDTEFLVEDADTRASLMERWERGWAVLFDALAALAPADLLREVRIRGEAHTVVEALNRQLTHYGYHTGQIVFLAKHLKSADWKTLSVARGASDAFNAKMMSKAEGTESAK